MHVVIIQSVGLPKPANLRMINFTNTSITLRWEYPPPPIEAIENFLVSLNATVRILAILL